MCADEAIPAVGRIGRLRQTLEDIGEELDEGYDIFALERNLGTNDEVVECQNYVTNHLDVDHIREGLLNRGRTRIPFALAQDYENIFMEYGLSRRSARVLPLPGAEPPHQEPRDLMFQWVIQSLDDPSPRMDLDVPDVTKSFPNILEYCLPVRLDLNNWIAGYLLNLLAVRLTGEAGHRWEFQEWQPWMGSGGQKVVPHGDGSYHDIIPFLGRTGEGRLVWIPKERWPLAQNDRQRNRYRSIYGALEKAEKALITLSRHIANEVVLLIISSYVIPQALRQGRPMLDRKQIGRATREILGEAWFELPFDFDGELRNWSEDDILKPDHLLTDDDMFIDDYDDEDDTGDASYNSDREETAEPVEVPRVE